MDLSVRQSLLNQIHGTLLDVSANAEHLSVADVHLNLQILQGHCQLDGHQRVDVAVLEGKQDHFKDLLVREGQEFLLAHTTGQHVQLHQRKTQFLLLLQLTSHQIMQQSTYFEGVRMIQRRDFAVESRKLLQTKALYFLIELPQQTAHFFVGAPHDACCQRL